MRFADRCGLAGFPRLSEFLVAFGLTGLGACSPAASSPSTASGGSAGSNSASGGQVATGGAASTSGGAANGGSTPSGGSVTSGGNAPLGGSSSGGSNNGGASVSVATGGSAGASTASGGSSPGGGSPAGGANAGASAGGKASGCNGSANGVLFCDDFEKGTADAAPSGSMWTTSYIGPDAPRIVVDATSPAHSGTRSVAVTAPLGNFQTFLNYHDAGVLPRASGDFYLRAWLRLNRPMADHHNAYLILDRSAAPGAGAAVRLGEQANMLSLTAGGDAHGTLANANFSNDQILGAHLTTETWACLEGYFNSATPTIAFWLDGVEIKDFHHTDWPADAYDTIHFGFEKYAGPELTVWFDDIAIGSARIGCQ